MSQFWGPLHPSVPDFVATSSNTQNVTFSANGGSGGWAPYDVLNFRSCTTCNEGFVPLVTQVDVIDPRGNTRRVAFNQNGYPSTDIRALGKPEQETTDLPPGFRTRLSMIS
jgi:hypothetical protein